MAYPGNKLQTIGDIYLIDLCIQYLLVPILRLFACNYYILLLIFGFYVSI